MSSPIVLALVIDGRKVIQNEIRMFNHDKFRFRTFIFLIRCFRFHS